MELSFGAKRYISHGVIFLQLVGWLVGFYGLSTLIGYLIPNPVYTYILNVYDL